MVSACAVRHRLQAGATCCDTTWRHGAGRDEGGTGAVCLQSRWAQRAPEQREAVLHRPQRVGREVARPYGAPRPAGLQQQVCAVQPARLPDVLRVVQVKADGARQSAVRRVHQRYDGRACNTWRVGWRGGRLRRGGRGRREVSEGWETGG